MATANTTSPSAFAQTEPRQTPILHLVDALGSPVDPQISYGVTRAYLALLKKFDGLDPSLLANWAEDAARFMQSRAAEMTHPGAYAYNRLKWMIFNYSNLKSSQLETTGTAVELEFHTKAVSSSHHDAEYRLFLGKVRASLDDRENLILELLINGYTLPEMVSILGLSHSHGRQTIARVKAKIRTLCNCHDARPDRRHCTAEAQRQARDRATHGINMDTPPLTGRTKADNVVNSL